MLTKQFLISLALIILLIGIEEE